MKKIHHYHNSLSKEQREAIAAELRISTGYFRLLCTGHRVPGASLAKLLARVTPFTAEDWRPDLFDGAA